jgi:hypothetical protein
VLYVTIRIPSGLNVTHKRAQTMKVPRQYLHREKKEDTVFIISLHCVYWAMSSAENVAINHSNSECIDKA